VPRAAGGCCGRTGAGRRASLVPVQVALPRFLQAGLAAANAWRATTSKLQASTEAWTYARKDRKPRQRQRPRPKPRLRKELDAFDTSTEGA